jgi:hypothetical protein
MRGLVIGGVAKITGPPCATSPWHYDHTAIKNEGLSPQRMAEPCKHAGEPS